MLPAPLVVLARLAISGIINPLLPVLHQAPLSVAGKLVLRVFRVITVHLLTSNLLVLPETYPTHVL